MKRAPASTSIGAESLDAIEWCRQRLLVPGNPLAASLFFVPEAQRSSILALRAVIAEIAGIAGSVSDAGVAQSKLGWWRDALSRTTAHPALEAAERTGVLAAVEASYFDALIDGVRQSLEAPRFERVEDCWDHCRGVGGSAAILEAKLMGASDDLADKLATLGAAAYQFRMVRDLAIDARANRWLVPLQLQAEFQISRQDALKDRGSPGWNALVRAMIGDALGRGLAVERELDKTTARCHRHLLITWSLDQRLARALARRPGRILRERILPGAMGNVWRAWRKAVSLNAR